MTNTAYIGNFDQLEIAFTPAGGERRVLATNTRTGPTWNLDVKSLHDLDLKTLRGLGYMLLKMACTKLPLDPDHQAGVAAVAAYQAAQRALPTTVNKTQTEDAKGSWQEILSLMLDPGDGATIKRAVRNYLQALEQKTP